MKKIIVARSVVQALGGSETIFRRGTVTTYAARTSEEILNLHSVHRADLIVTEVGLPHMGGAELCSKIRSDEDLKKVSIIMVCDRPEAAAECNKTLVNAVISAPIDPLQFFSTMSELLIIPQRKDLRVLLRATVKGREEKAGFFAMSANISISGMLLVTDRALRKGDRLTCSFSLGHREIKTECLVARVSSSRGRYVCGVSFVNLDTKSLIIIEQFVKAGGRN